MSKKKQTLRVNVSAEATDGQLKVVREVFSKEFDVYIRPNIVRLSEDQIPFVIQFAVEAMVAGAFYESLKKSLVELYKKIKAESLGENATVKIIFDRQTYIISKDKIFLLGSPGTQKFSNINELVKYFIEFKSLPKLIVFAGANGAGKTTLAKQLLPYAKVDEFVNADNIARGLSPFNPSGSQVEAGRLMLERVDSLIQKKKDFAIETTLSGLTLIRKLKAAQKAGYHIRLYYVYTQDVKINIKRIRLRVRQGKHFVPDMDVKRRYVRSLKNLFQVYWPLCDTIVIYDSTQGEVEAIASKTGKDNLLYRKDRKDVWFKILQGSKS